MVVGVPGVPSSVRHAPAYWGNVGVAVSSSILVDVQIALLQTVSQRACYISNLTRSIRVKKPRVSHKNLLRVEKWMKWKNLLWSLSQNKGQKEELAPTSWPSKFDQKNKWIFWHLKCEFSKK